MALRKSVIALIPMLVAISTPKRNVEVVVFWRSMSAVRTDVSFVSHIFEWACKTDG